MKDKVLVVGFGGKSGVAAVNFLVEQGYSVIANDNKKKRISWCFYRTGER